jgi:glycine cleavage system H lipoate-binding protein
MTQKVYKTAQGKTLDMGRLILQNEKTRAVGNMNVNARGDVIDDNNQVVSSKPEQVNRQYNRQVTNTKK